MGKERTRSDGEGRGKRAPGEVRIPDPARAREKVRRHHQDLRQKATTQTAGQLIGAEGRLVGYAHTATVDTTEWKRLISVEGPGWLTALGVAGGPRYHEFQVEIDGRIVVGDFLAGTGVRAHVNNGIGVDLPFYEHLEVRARDRPRGSSIVRYWVCWLSEEAELVSEDDAVEDVDGVAYRVSRRRYRRADDSSAVVESLLGPQRVSEILLERDWVELDRTEGNYARLEASLLIRDATEEASEQLPAASAEVRPAGRQTPVALIPVGESAPVEPIHFPGPGEYEISANLNGFHNLPTYFTAL